MALIHNAVFSRMSQSTLTTILVPAFLYSNTGEPASQHIKSRWLLHQPSPQLPTTLEVRNSSYLMAYLTIDTDSL